MYNSDARLVPEWAPQDALVLAWPHSNTDWSGMLEEIERTYIDLAQAIVRWQPLVILAKDRDALAQRLIGYGPERIVVIEAETNDTWVRDYLPLWIRRPEGYELLDFGFNAWGEKFSYNKDNAVTRRLFTDNLLFSNRVIYRDLNDFILEGGSIETDGMGTVITTERCLCADNRNPMLSKVEIDHLLRQHLYARDILWLKDGYLEGDDTDGHIDTLVRFCAPDVLAYASCEDRSDTQYNSIKRMGEELHEWAQKSGQHYRLVPVPVPPPIRDRQGQRLPATYLNFVILRGAVLVPIYSSDCDSDALRALEGCFPDRELIGIHAGALIKQGGSIHCATAHIPQGCLKKL
jgi:agmatine deiminase